MAGFSALNQSIISMAENMTCTDIVAKWNGSTRCNIVSQVYACEQYGLINFNALSYCQFDGRIEITLPIYVCLAVVIFYMLGLTADSFLTPNMVSISTKLNIPGHIAGVTFLAFANGAPDLFSVFAAIDDGPETASMAFGAAFGAALVVVTMVISAIIFVQPFQFKRRPFIRDISLFLLAAGSITGILYDGKVTILEAVGLVSLYFVYVIAVAVGHVIYKSEWFQRNDPLRPKIAIQGGKGEKVALLTKNHFHNEAYIGVEEEYGFNQDVENPILKDDDKPTVSTFSETASPIFTEEWRTANHLRQLVLVLRSPLVFLLRWTTPVIVEAERDRWCRSLFALQCLVAPNVIVFLTQAHWGWSGQIPDWGILFIVGAIFALAVLALLPADKPPEVYGWLSLVGFFMSVVWVYIIADTAVDLLSALGVLCGVSDALIGLIVLGLGNSVGDLAANAAVARKGHPTMAASACFGAPALNMLLGIGGSYLYVTLSRSSSVIFETKTEREQLLTSGYMLLGVLGFLGIYVTCRNFYADRVLASLLILIYGAFFITSIILEVY